MDYFLTTVKHFIIVFCALVTCTSYGQVNKAPVSLTEPQKIEYLIKCVEGLNNAIFDRNGTLYSSQAAASHLKMKWEKAGNTVKTGFFYASNFSLGVNLFFELNKKLAQLMNPFKEYSIRINEIHHTHKLDAPSGTAITLAEVLIMNTNHLTIWKNSEDVDAGELPIVSYREGEVPGTHEIIYDSDIDSLSIKQKRKAAKVLL
jgi:dihydrodipicolinate reductase